MTSDMQNPSPSQTPGNAGDPVKKAQASGLPVRGLAMILIAVAVLLAAWALWSLSTDNDADSAATGTTQSQDEGAQSDGEASGGFDFDDASGEGVSAENTEAETPREEDGARDAEAETAENEEAPAAERPARPAAEGTPVTTLHVLNNSTVTQLAARVADSLDSDYDKVESGNLADIAIPQNTVYFTKGNPDAEKEARKLADRVGGIAMERSDVLPKETDGDDAIVLVLTEDVAL